MNNVVTSSRVTSASLRGPSRRLKVLQVGKFYPPHMGGIETHLQALCSQLRESVDLEVVVANDSRHRIEERIDGVQVSRIPTISVLASTPVCPGMIARIRASRADIVHIHLPNPLAILSYLASGYGGRLLVTYHSDTVRQKRLATLFEPFLHAALRRSSAIIATSPDYLRTSAVLAHHLDRCHVIPYGIALDRFEHCDTDAVLKLRQEYGERLVLSTGRLVYYKGFEYLIRAMIHVRGKLIIIGDGPLRAKLQALIDSLDLHKKVILAGQVQNDQIVPYYHAADVFALASVERSEAFGIVQIEAMSAGLPVVNTALDSGVPFVSLDGQTGLTVPPANPDALSAAINRLLDEPRLRQSFGDAARRRARQQFSLEAMTSRTLGLYEHVMKGAPVPG
jgi:glycosyltransferase involved in cell wall biosynthesis